MVAINLESNAARDSEFLHSFTLREGWIGYFGLQHGQFGYRGTKLLDYSMIANNLEEMQPGICIFHVT